MSSEEFPSGSSCSHGPERARPLSELLRELATDSSRERVSIGDLLVALHDRALAALLLIFALPNVIPVPPGTSALLGAPLLFLAAQLAFGMRPWLPRIITERSMHRPQFAALIAGAAPWLARAERLLRPRLGVLCRPPAEYGVGLLCLLLSVIVFLPIPLGNMLPALAICLLALGVLERDGLWVLAGVFTAAAAFGLVSGVLYALAKAALFIISHAFQ
jgi:hypothetical protein